MTANLFCRMGGKTMVHRPGFTLLEIMVAVLIFGIIMLTIFTSFRSFTVSSRMIQDNISQWEKGDALLSILSKDIRAMRIALAPEYTRPDTLSASGSLKADPFRIKGDTMGVNGTSFSTLTFASLSHIAFGGDTRTGVARIGYYVRSAPGRGFDLCRSDTLDLFKEMEPLECDPVICRNITEFTLTYHDVEDAEYSHWDSESDDFLYATPVDVHIVVAFETEQGRQHGENGKVKRFGMGSDREPDQKGVRKIETRIVMPLFRRGEKP